MNEHLPSTPVSLNRSQVQYLEGMSNEEFWHYAISVVELASLKDNHDTEYLLCDLEVGSCLLPTAALCEVVSPPYHFTYLPAMPHWMVGLAAWHDELIAVINICAYLWDRQITTRPDGLLLTVRQGELTLGMSVSAVCAIHTMSAEQIRPLEQEPEWSSFIRIGAVSGVGKDALLLDLPFIFTDVVQRLKE